MPSIAERVEGAWQELLDAIDGLSPEQMSEPGVNGEWSVKDTLAHIAFWENNALESLERALAGQPEPPEDPEWDLDRINADVYAQRAEWTAEEVLEDLHGTHARLVAALHLLPEVAPERVAPDTWDHYPEHAEAIRRWRERVGI